MKKPFVKLFDAFEGHFCYDVNTNAILQISDAENDIVKEYCRTGDLELLKKAPELAEYVNRGYFSSFRPSVIQHSKTDYIKSYIYRKTEKICLQITKDCNYKCRYCGFASDNKLNRNHEDEVMSFETAKKAIDFLISLSERKSSLNVGFYGGEPFLCTDMIERCVSYCEEKYPMKEWRFSATTNGSICSQKIIDLINNHSFYLTMSLDGPKRLHDKNRRWLADGTGTFDRVMKNYHILKEKIVDKEKLSINSVSDKEEKYDEYLHFFEGKEFQGIRRTQGVIDDARLAKNIVISDLYRISANKEQLMEYMNLYLSKDENEYCKGLVFDDLKKVEMSFDKTHKLGSVEHHNGPCIPGAERLFVSTKGMLYPCEKCSENSPIFTIGDLDHGFNYDKIIYLLNVGKVSENECKDCFAIKQCSCCAQKIDNGISLDRKMKLRICEREKQRVMDTMKKYVFLKVFLQGGNKYKV